MVIENKNILDVLDDDDHDKIVGWIAILSVKGKNSYFSLRYTFKESNDKPCFVLMLLPTYDSEEYFPVVKSLAEELGFEKNTDINLHVMYLNNAREMCKAEFEETVDMFVAEINNRLED